MGMSHFLFCRIAHRWRCVFRPIRDGTPFAPPSSAGSVRAGAGGALKGIYFVFFLL